MSKMLHCILLLTQYLPCWWCQQQLVISNDQPVSQIGLLLKSLSPNRAVKGHHDCCDGNSPSKSRCSSFEKGDFHENGTSSPTLPQSQTKIELFIIYCCVVLINEASKTTKKCRDFLGSNLAEVEN